MTVPVSFGPKNSRTCDAGDFTCGIMPSSDINNIAPILAVLQNSRPASVLDVGCGFGKYGYLAREYLDVQRGRLRRDEWQIRVVGVEAFAAYHNPVWDFIYDKVHIGKAEEVVPTLGTFDTIIMADIIEHFHKDAAEALVAQALKQCSMLIISTPAYFFSQGDLYGNEHERHHILFTGANFPKGTHVATLPCNVCNVFVASRQAIAGVFIPGRLYWKGLSLWGKIAWPLKRVLGRGEI